MQTMELHVKSIKHVKLLETNVTYKEVQCDLIGEGG